MAFFVFLVRVYDIEAEPIGFRNSEDGGSTRIRLT